MAPMHPSPERQYQQRRPRPPWHLRRYLRLELNLRQATLAPPRAVLLSLTLLPSSSLPSLLLESPSYPYPTTPHLSLEHPPSSLPSRSRKACSTTSTSVPRACTKRHLRTSEEDSKRETVDLQRKERVDRTSTSPSLVKCLEHGLTYRYFAVRLWSPTRTTPVSPSLASSTLLRQTLEQHDSRQRSTRRHSSRRR
jgi:hypothetical protein